MLTIFGITLGWLRWKTGSVYPGMVVHASSMRPLSSRGDDVSERFDEIRREIAANDEAIVAAVNRRLQLVAELWRLKAELGLDTVDPDRERRLREHSRRRTRTAVGRSLDRLVTDLLDLTKRELRRRASAPT